jgi:hypothetical protein
MANVEVAWVFQTAALLRASRLPERRAAKRFHRDNG